MPETDRFQKDFDAIRAKAEGRKIRAIADFYEMSAKQREEVPKEQAKQELIPAAKEVRRKWLVLVLVLIPIFFLWAYLTGFGTRSLEATARFYFDHFIMLVCVFLVMWLQSGVVHRIVDNHYLKKPVHWLDNLQDYPPAAKTVRSVSRGVGISSVWLGIITWVVFSNYASYWWTGISVHAPQTRISISPLTDSFTQSQMVNLVVEITNLSKASISELSLTFPKSFSDNFVIDYLNASYMVAYAGDINEVDARLVQWVIGAPSELVNPFLAGKQISAKIDVAQDQTFRLLIPIQLTDYGNFAGELDIKVGATDLYVVTPIGSYGTEPTVTNFMNEKFVLNWTVLQRQP